MSENMNDLEQKKVYARALDPIHIGAGGYRLGRVDNTVVRDPATDIPKIPGTSIAGVAREFYTVSLMKSDECKNKGDENEKRKCAEEKVNLKFGTDTKKGLIRFYDGQIIFFPVSSIQGTVWITTKELIEYWFEEIENSNGEKIKIPDKIEDKVYSVKDIKSGQLNLGWLLLDVVDISNGKEINLPNNIGEFVKKIVIVSEKLFSHIVNDNLEVRTSVRIDPTTGTAAERALFTYEAIPRGTVFGFEIGADNSKDISTDVNTIINAVSSYFKLLGIGGMGTRGFGRIEIVCPAADKNNSNENSTDKKGE